MDELYLLAKEMMDRGAYQDSIKIFDKIIKDYPDAAEIYKAYHHKGHCLGKLRLYNEAIECDNIVLLQHPNTATVLNKAYALYKLKKYSDALHVLDSIIDNTFLEDDNMCAFISFYERVCNKIHTLSQPLQSSQNEYSGMENLERAVLSGDSTSDNQNQTLLGGIIDISMNINENN